MVVYFDGVHLVADTLEELHTFAADIGIKRCWFHNNKKHPHYDCINKNKDKVLAAKSVTMINSRTMVKMGLT